MKEIQLTQGKVALVDDCDFDDLNQYQWFAFKGNKTFYAGRSVNTGKIKPRQQMEIMHRRILEAPIGVKVDHKDCNGLNNQRNNIRICSVAQNQYNAIIRCDNFTGFKGVYPFGKKYGSHIRFEKKNRFLGYYNTSKEAAVAYNKAAIEMFGEFAKLNIIPGETNGCQKNS